MDKNYIPSQLNKDFHEVLMNLTEVFQSKVLERLNQI